MHLTQTAEYALRTMAQLAVAPEGEAIRAKDLCEQTHVPLHYQSKLLRRLVVAGLLISKKGHSGGFLLAKRPSSIRLIDVLEAVDAGFPVDRCGFGWGQCDPEHPCPLHPVWGQLSESCNDWARRRTLEDVRRNWLGLDEDARGRAE